jgi:hypothetical protein
LRPAIEIDVRLRDAPGKPELAVHNGCARVADAHRAKLAEQRALVAVAIANRRACQHGEQSGDRRMPRCRRSSHGRLAAVGRLGEAAEVEAERAIGGAQQGELRAVNLDSARRDPPEHEFVKRQRDFGARYVHAPPARLVDHRDVGDAQVERTIDAKAETLPGQCDRADGKPRRAAIGIRRFLQPAGEPWDIDRPLRQAPRECGDPGSCEKCDGDHHRHQAVQHHGEAESGLTRKAPHAQLSRG